MTEGKRMARSIRSRAVCAPLPRATEGLQHYLLPVPLAARPNRTMCQPCVLRTSRVATLRLTTSCLHRFPRRRL